MGSADTYKDGTTMETAVYQDHHAVNRLSELDLSAEILTQAVSEGQLALSTCTANDPPLAPGIMFWSRTNRSLREQLIPQGWSRKNVRGQPLTLNPEKDMAIVAFSGDEATGIVGRTPQSKHPKGAATLAAIRSNQQQLRLPFPGLLDPAPTPNDEPDRLTWVLLSAKERGQIRLELSLPKAVGENGVVVSWAERIILPTIQLGDDPVVLIDDGDEPPVDVEVIRRRS